jgi:hypothetical protein
MKKTGLGKVRYCWRHQTDMGVLSNCFYARIMLTQIRLMALAQPHSYLLCGLAILAVWLRQGVVI